MAYVYIVEAILCTADILCVYIMCTRYRSYTAQGYKRTVKHSAREHEVLVSMRKMNAGHTKTV